MKHLKIFFFFILSALLIITGGRLMGNIFEIAPIIPAIGLVAASLIPLPKGMTCINIFSAPGGIATPFTWNMQYLPQFLSFINVVPLTSLRVETAEDGVLHDWTAAGLVAMANFLQVGTMTANILQFRLADGEIAGRNVTVSGITSAAGVVPFFVSSDNKGRTPYLSKNAVALAGIPTTIRNFTAIFAPTMATVTDRAEIAFSNNHKQTYNMEDLRDLSGIYQQTQTVCVNNINSYIKEVTFTCAANTPLYILSYKL